MPAKHDPPKSLAELKAIWREADATLKKDAPAEEPADPTAPVKRRWNALPDAMFRGGDGTFELYGDGVDYTAGATRQTLRLGAIQSVSIEDGADLEARITATRLVLVGVFALALRKRRGGEKYLTIESTDTVTVVEVDRKSIAKAQKFAAAVRTAVKGA